MGPVLDSAIQRISSDVLALPDITEIESDRLNELFQSIHSLEVLFVPEQEQVSRLPTPSTGGSSSTATSSHLRS